jgi:nicotinate (nicotinamide) nucleotide adenylyltransferase
LAATEKHAFSDIVVVPSAGHPMRGHGPVESFDRRSELAQRAFGAIPVAKIWRVEEQEHQPTVYKLSLLQQARPSAELFLIIGCDLLKSIPTWSNFETLCTQCSIVAVGRAGFSADLSALESYGYPKDVAQKIRQLFVHSAIQISSSTIREQIRGDSDFLGESLPAPVWDAISSNGLYKAATSDRIGGLGIHSSPVVNHITFPDSAFESWYDLFRPRPATILKLCETRKGSVGCLVLDDSKVQEAIGGFQIRSQVDVGFRTPAEVAYFTARAARQGTIKCKLSGMPVAGGKLVVSLPPTIAHSPGERTSEIACLVDALQPQGFFARPDVGCDRNALVALRLGGGVGSSHEGLQNAGKNTAASLFGALQALTESYFKGYGVDDLKIIFDGADGRIGSALLEMLQDRGARRIFVVDRGVPDMEQHARGFPLVPVAEHQVCHEAGHIYCFCGPPEFFSMLKLKAVQTRVLMGPGNDILANPWLYEQRDRLLVLPGALATAASATPPQLQAAFDHEDISASSWEIVKTVLGKHALHEQIHGHASIFRVMYQHAMERSMR